MKPTYNNIMKHTARTIQTSHTLVKDYAPIRQVRKSAVYICQCPPRSQRGCLHLSAYFLFCDVLSIWSIYISKHCTVPKANLPKKVSTVICATTILQRSEAFAKAQDFSEYLHTLQRGHTTHITISRPDMKECIQSSILDIISNLWVLGMQHLGDSFSTVDT